MKNKKTLRGQHMKLDYTRIKGQIYSFFTLGLSLTARPEKLCF